MTTCKGIGGLASLLIAMTAVTVCPAQSDLVPPPARIPIAGNNQLAGKLPPNAKVREITPDEMKRYDAAALASAAPKISPVVYAGLRGIEAIDPAKLQILRQQKMAATEVRQHAAEPVPPGLGIKPSNPNAPLSPIVTRARATPLMQPSSGGGIPSSAPAPLAHPMLAPTGAGSNHTLMASTSGNSSHNPSVPGTSPIPLAIPPKSGLGTSRGDLPNVRYVCQSPTIFEVNKQAKNTIFTPETEYNAYVIKGCMFGQQTGKVYLIGKFNAQQVNLDVQFWSDTEIDARVDPKIAGEQDQQNISLIVAPVGTAQIKASGFEFIAARSNPAVLLNSVPQSWLSNSGWSGGFTNPTMKYVSPVIAGSNAPMWLAGYSVFVTRSSNKKFSPGADTLTPQMAPGWTFDSVQMISVNVPPSCPPVNTYKQTFGTAQASMFPITPDWTKLQRQGVHVDGSDISCSGFIPIAPPLVYYTYSDSTGSAYGLKIWAKGPRCTDPYSGAPQLQCVRNLQQCGTESCGN